MLDHSRGRTLLGRKTRQIAAIVTYQLRLNPALRLLLAAPDGVSPIEPEMVTPSNSFCSAPTLRSHLSSEVDRVWPAIRLVPVSVMLSLADWSVSWLRAGWLTMPGTGTRPC